MNCPVCERVLPSSRTRLCDDCNDVYKLDDCGITELPFALFKKESFAHFKATEVYIAVQVALLVAEGGV